MTWQNLFSQCRDFPAFCTTKTTSLSGTPFSITCLRRGTAFPSRHLTSIPFPVRPLSADIVSSTEWRRNDNIYEICHVWEYSNLKIIQLFVKICQCFTLLSLILQDAFIVNCQFNSKFGSFPLVGLPNLDSDNMSITSDEH